MLTVTLIRPVHMLVAEPIVFFLSLYNSFTFSVLFGYFAAYPYTFSTVYGFNQWQTGLAFLGVFIGVLLAVSITILIDRKMYMKKYRQAMKEGKVAAAPEHRLYAAMYGSFGVLVGCVETYTCSRGYFVDSVLGSSGLPGPRAETCTGSPPSSPAYLSPGAISQSCGSTSHTS